MCFSVLSLQLPSLWGMGRLLLPAKRHLWKVRGGALKPWRASGMFGMPLKLKNTPINKNWFHTIGLIDHRAWHILRTRAQARLRFCLRELRWSFWQRTVHRLTAWFSQRQIRSTTVCNHALTCTPLPLQVASHFCSNVVAWQFGLAASSTGMPQGSLWCIGGSIGNGVNCWPYSFDKCF